MLSLRVSVIIAAAVAQSAAQLIDCYGWGGQEYTGNTRCPNSNACCGPSDECLSNRLCYRPSEDIYIRGPCALPGYDEETCAQICLYNETTSTSTILPRVTICDDGSLCCDNDRDCCDNGDGVFLDVFGTTATAEASTTFTWGTDRTESGFSATTGEPSTSTTSSSTSTTTTESESSTSSSAPATSGTTSFAPTETGDPEEQNGGDDSSSSNGLAVGLGVGLGLAVLLIAAGLGWFFWRRRQQRDRGVAGGAAPHPSAVEVPAASGAEKYRYGGQMPPEMAGHESAYGKQVHHAAELDGGQFATTGAVEMDATGGRY
jgi:hypothetical protein